MAKDVVGAGTAAAGVEISLARRGPSPQRVNGFTISTPRRTLPLARSSEKSTSHRAATAASRIMASQSESTLVDDVVEAMNSGARLDAILQEVRVPESTLALPYLRPMYDEPEFMIRNIWRLYGGWWDANPARLKPPSDVAIGVEIAALAGGVERLVKRAGELSEAGDHRLACQLIELATAAAPESRDVHKVRRRVYEARRPAETSLMAKGIYLSAAADSQTFLEGAAPPVKMVLSIGEE